MEALEPILYVLAILFVLYARYGKPDEGQRFAYEGVMNFDKNVEAVFDLTNFDIGKIELETPVMVDPVPTDVNLDETEEGDDGLPPWDVEDDKVTTSLTEPTETVVVEETTIEEDTDSAEIVEIDVSTIKATVAWKAAQKLGLPYKNGRKRLSVGVLRQNIANFLETNPERANDLSEFVA